ncbi:MAG: carboxy terminal-processing peptidase [Verrucomicrobiota bacterium]
MFSRLSALSLVVPLYISSLFASQEGSEWNIDNKYRTIGKLVPAFLERQHYLQEQLNHEHNEEWLSNYMKSYDFNHAFFYRKDYEELMQMHGNDLTTKLMTGNIEPAFNVFDLFKKRLESRVAWIEKRLRESFDFTQDEYYSIDRSEVPWPESEEKADELWESRLKYDLLQERLIRVELAEKKKEEGEEQDKKEISSESPQEKVLKRYKTLLKTFSDYEDEDIMTTYLSALTSVYDPHSQYLGPSQLADFSIAMKLELFGIGAVLTTENGYCTVREVISGGPADLDGRLEVNDRIVGVAQGNGEYEDVVGMRLRKAVQLIRGPKDTIVRLKVFPGDSDVVKEITIVRNKIDLKEAQAKAEVLEIEYESGARRKLGLIELPSFYGDISSGASPGSKSRSTSKDVAVLIKRLKEEKVEGLVLDLRKNGGGLLSEAVNLVGLFIDKGPVVQIQGVEGRKDVLRDNDSGALYGGPLIVLTNRESASASEICAGALQNYRRALVVGESSTHGKGTVQSVIELNRWMNRDFGRTRPEAGALKLTMQKFYLPNGDSTQNRGVLPNIALPSVNDYLEIGESHLPHSLPWDQTASVPYKAVNYIDSELIGQLTELSKRRISSSPDYQFLLKDIERVSKRVQEKRISLNENKRIEELKEEKVRRKARKEAIKVAVKNFKIKVLSITLDNLEGEYIESLKDRNENKREENEDENFFDDLEIHAVDHQLRETFHIMDDMLRLSAANHELITAQKVGAKNEFFVD